MTVKPKIRFKEFTDDIKGMPLSEFLYESTERNKELKYSKNDVLSVSGEYGIVNQIAFQGRSFAGKSVANYHIVKIGDIVYTKSPLKENPYGIIKSNKGKTGIVSTLYAVYHPKKNIISDFVQYYFEDNLRLNKFLKPLVNIGTKHDMKINNSYMLTGTVYFPSQKEQKKIVGLFSTLDDVIDSVQKELDSWEQMKRGVMQKLFSQEVRFKADDGSEFPDWTMIKADDLFENITDKNHPNDTVLTIIQGKGTVPRENAGRNIQYDKKYLSTYKRVEKNDFIIHLRSFEGGLEIANETGIVSPAYVILRSKKEIAPGFYNAYFHSNEFIYHNLPRTVEGIRDGRQISYTAFEQLYLPWCCFEEQQKIADCLSEFDSVIEKTKQKLEAYKQLKKGLMQRMFV